MHNLTGIVHSKAPHRHDIQTALCSGNFPLVHKEDIPTKQCIQALIGGNNTQNTQYLPGTKLKEREKKKGKELSTIWTDMNDSYEFTPPPPPPPKLPDQFSFSTHFWSHGGRGAGWGITAYKQNSKQSKAKSILANQLEINKEKIVEWCQLNSWNYLIF